MGRSERFLGFVTAVAFLVVAGDLRAELHFDQSVLDAGTVYAGAPLVRAYRFINRGPAPVVLTDARVSCGCLTPRLEKRAYQSGESGEVTLEVHTLSQPAGPNTWQVQLTYQDGEATRSLPLQLRAQLIKEVAVQPAVMTVYADAEVQHEIQLTDLRKSPLHVSAVRTTSERVKAELAEPGHMPCKVRVRVPSSCPVGQHFDAVAIYTDDPAYPELRVPVTIVKRPRQPVTAVPPEVSLVGTPGEPLPSRIILVRDRDDRQVVVEAVNAADPAVSCRFASGPGNDVTIRLELDSSQIVGGRLESAVHIQVRQPVQEVVVVPIRCALE